MSVFAFDRAIVRTPAASVVDGLRTGPHHGPSHRGVLSEHLAYVSALEAAGLAVETLPALEAYPDSVFVEDPAFVLPEGAILLRPGASSRIGEVEEIAPVLRARFERVLALDNGHADGGDILWLPEEIVIGMSARTDREGAGRFVELAGKLGRQARIVATPRGVLHFKTACALIDEGTVIATAEIASSGIFQGYDVIITPDGEEAAANLLRLNKTVLIGADYPRTAELVARHGLDVVPLEVAEIGRIDAGLSCMSLRWNGSAKGADKQ